VDLELKLKLLTSTHLVSYLTLPFLLTFEAQTAILSPPPLAEPHTRGSLLAQESKVRSVGIMLTLGPAVGCGATVGWSLGLALGFTDALGWPLGCSLGLTLGLSLGCSLGLTLGLSLGCSLGLSLGCSLGVTLGVTLGNSLGWTLGLSLGCSLGLSLGCSLGVTLGVALGNSLGWTLGFTDTLGWTLGEALGWAVGPEGDELGEGVAQNSKVSPAQHPQLLKALFLDFLRLLLGFTHAVS